ncbi:potassium channel subfamily K member 6-like isoform X1 [Bradysia coprophila]|uniref:potassium channel subfamily K member 6-like isoform X1 n=1 Tax=Bradysia coprophila TaxID=38358 RepID=UPI00187DD423|nr:potassium channel subfamily K member 6-like isoform X1 [Bradysia coprophila]XP_037029605.1 potassium channel subfamily K member 6-like isoform X1 [Bradysia coprophila]
MEEQGQLYQYYFYSEHNRRLNFVPIYDNNKPVRYQRNDYIERDNRYASSETSRMFHISLPCLSRCRRRSFAELSDNESTPLLHGNGTSQKKLSPHRKRILLTVFIVFYAGFLILGSITFRTFELSVELEQRQSYRDVRQAFLMKHPSVLDDDLEEFVENIVKVSGKGVSVLRNATGDLNWSFGQALIFSATVITTIGYGHVTPLSEAGKIFCIIYATVGIPLTLVLISAMVERLLIPTNWILGKLNSKLGHLYQPFNIRLLHLALIATIFAVIFFAVPTIIFSHLEPNWTPLDAFYYCFISLTTIGLGDFIPGDGVDLPNRSWYRVFITIYLIFGIIGMMLTLTVFYEIPQLNLGQLFTENSMDDTEKVRLSQNNPPFYSGPSGLYIPQRDDEVRRSVVRIRPHGDDDSPSPDDPTPMHAKDIRVP